MFMLCFVLFNYSGSLSITVTHDATLNYFRHVSFTKIPVCKQINPAYYTDTTLFIETNCNDRVYLNEITQLLNHICIYGSLLKLNRSHQFLNEWSQVMNNRMFAIISLEKKIQFTTEEGDGIWRTLNITISFDEMGRWILTSHLFVRSSDFGTACLTTSALPI